MSFKCWLKVLLKYKYVCFKSKAIWLKVLSLKKTNLIFDKFERFDHSSKLTLLISCGCKTRQLCTVCPCFRSILNQGIVLSVRNIFASKQSSNQSKLVLTIQVSMLEMRKVIFHNFGVIYLLKNHIYSLEMISKVRKCQ